MSEKPPSREGHERRPAGAASSLVDAALDGLRRAAAGVETERELAEALQRSLFAEDLPELPGLRAAVGYQAGGDEAEVGGDWFDVIPLRDGRVGLVIGDVVGHGVRAAARATHLQSALRAYALDGIRPSLVLERMNGFVGELERGGMATVMYVIVNPESGAVDLASAGHPPPVLIHPGGEVSYVEGRAGPPLGVIGVPAYDDAVTAVAPGTTLVLYTDGLIERPDMPLDQGLARLVTALGHSSLEPDQLCEELIASVSSTGRPRDDVAVLVARLELERELGEPLELSLPAEPESLARMRRSVSRWLRRIGSGDEETYEILVACGEAAANAVAHAYPAAEASFELTAALESGRIEVTVRDFGSWREPRPMAQGRGLLLMRELMDEVVIDRRKVGTTVTMRRLLASERERV